MRDMAEDIALDDMFSGGMDVPGKRNETPPSWAKPEKKLGLNYGKSSPPPTQTRISKNPTNSNASGGNSLVPWKDPDRNHKSSSGGSKELLPDNNYKSSQPSKFMGSMPTPFKPAKTPTKTTQPRKTPTTTTSQPKAKTLNVNPFTRQEKKSYAAHEAEKAKTVNAFSDLRGRIRESEAKAKAEHIRQQNHEEVDRDGNVLRGDKAYAKNGTVVERGGYYTVRGWGHGIFRVTRILMRDKRIMAEGTEESPGHSANSAWHYVSQLKPYAMKGATSLHSGKSFMGIEI